MAGVNVDNSGLTFVRYLDGVVETLNQQSNARNLIRQEDRWGGENIEFRIHTARNHALGYTVDGGAFPVADKQDYVAATVGRKFLVGSIQLTDGVLATASKTKNVAKDVVSSEVEGMMQGMLKFENGMFFKNGDGSVATVQTGTATTSLLVDDARMIWDGATYDVYNSTLATNYGTCTVTRTASSLTAAGYATVTLDANIPDSTAGNKIVWRNSLNRAITGLSKLIDDSGGTSALQGVTIATYPRWASMVLDNSLSANRDLTPQLFRQLLAGIYQRCGSTRPAEGLKVLCSSWQAMNVEELYEGELRMTPESKTAGLAVAAFQTSLGRVDILVDSDAPYHEMFFVDPSQIYRAVQKPLAWRREEGGGIFKRSDTAGVWTATAIEIAEMYIKERHTSGRLTDLNETVKVAY